MTISAASRYNEGETLWIKTAKRGNKQTVYLNTVTSLTSPYGMSLMRDGDNMTAVAASAYGDPRRWWIIADANPQWFYPMDSFPGQSLRVPT
jgi:hypothetical protein